MDSLKNFIKKFDDKKALPAAKIQQPAIQIAGALMASGLSITKSSADKFGHEVNSLASSDEVISELSTKLGEPYQTETEEEFVNRAKSTLKNILKVKLKKK
jgi:hypothetical protein